MLKPVESNPPQNGDLREIEGTRHVYYDGYWIRYYPPLEETLNNKKKLIESLTRRTFHHTELGINTPGEKLEQARKAFEAEQSAERKRVNGAMLAGALFNRATDIFTEIVELSAKGVCISDDNELMRQCGDCFKEALELGKTVRHYSGEEGIDELWGEPFKAFAMPIAQFYESRYIKIAQTMRDIDLITDNMIEVFSSLDGFSKVLDLIREFSDAAKHEAETVRRDMVIFDVWPRFIAAKEAVENYRPDVPPMDQDHKDFRRVFDALELLQQGKEVLSYLAGARVIMPKTTKEYLQLCDMYKENGFLIRQI